MQKRAAPILLFALVSRGSAASALEPGAYEVSVRLELPHIEAAIAPKIARICVASDSGTSGLRVLSDNNPLGQCPASHVNHQGGTLSFDIVCPGENEAKGWAEYTIRADGFEGAIAMMMGGKNMTMTEYQSARRLGDCAVSNSSRSER
jgi:Protein of unknown function (DUF3617)